MLPDLKIFRGNGNMMEFVDKEINLVPWVGNL